MLLELLAAGALMWNDSVKLQAEAIAACAGFEIKNVSPKLGAALEQVAKRKGYWSPQSFYKWGDGDYADKCNLSYVRENYWLIDTLPSLAELDGFPSLAYIDDKYKQGSSYYSFLVKLKEVASPWELDNIQALIQETEKCQAPWATAWQIRSNEKAENPLFCRKSILKLQDELKGPISDIWSLPAVPFWRFPREK